MYISKKILSSFLILFAFLFIAPVVYAATSSDFQTKAQKFITANCSKKNLSNELSLYCFLFYKAQEQDAVNSNQQTSISNIQLTVTPIPGQINDLKSKQTETTQALSELKELVENAENTTDPEMKTVVFADNRPASFNSQWVDVRGGYETLAITLSITGNIAGYAIHFTNDPENATDQTGYTMQKDVNCNFTSSCPITTVPVLGDYYRISTGTSNGNVTSTGILRSENGAPYDKLVNVCFDVSTGNIKVLQGNSCHPHVRWQMPVKCVEGEPCKPDNPQDLYYLNNN